MEITYWGTQSASRYAVLHRSTDVTGPTLVFCPPFGEEMVRTYARLARWSKELTNRGISVLRYHPFGTGESDGTSADVTVDSLVKDAVTAQQIALKQISGHRRGYFGVRFGANIAVLAAALQPTDFLVLWCPVPSLRNYFRELLRFQVTIAAVNRSRMRSTQHMIAELEAGRSVDVSGYELSPDLYRQMTAIETLPNTPPARQILWLARPAEEHTAFPIVKRWRGEGSQVDFQVIPERAFWEYPGSTVPDRFATATVQWLSSSENRTNGKSYCFISE